MSARPGDQPDPPPGFTDSQLAVLLRQTQWAIDETTHDLPAGRTTPQKRDELARALEMVAGLLRAPAPGARPQTPAGRRSSGSAPMIAASVLTLPAAGRPST